MNARALILCLAALLLPGLAAAQGFAGLGTTAEGFLTPERGRALNFPKDEGAHPGYRIEWWYMTANLRGEDGQDYGVQWTLFRTQLAPEDGSGWASPVVWIGNAALTSKEQHFSTERLARGGIGQAGVTADPFEAWIDNWQLAGKLPQLRVRASSPDFAFDLALEQTGPRVLQGDQGYSVKSREGQASYYYSYPFLKVNGMVTLPGGPVKVTGQAWIDREWSSQPLSKAQSGWDWISLHLEGGAKLMGFALRERGDDRRADFISGTWIAPGGTPTALGAGDLIMTPLEVAEVAGRRVPVRWRVQLPARGVDVTLTPLNQQAWMATSFPYWEGPVSISGSTGGTGYLEMTGYE